MFENNHLCGMFVWCTRCNSEEKLLCTTLHIQKNKNSTCFNKPKQKNNIYLASIARAARLNCSWCVGDSASFIMPLTALTSWTAQRFNSTLCSVSVALSSADSMSLYRPCTACLNENTRHLSEKHVNFNDFGAADEANNTLSSPRRWLFACVRATWRRTARVAVRWCAHESLRRVAAPGCVDCSPGRHSTIDCSTTVRGEGYGTELSVVFEKKKTKKKLQFNGILNKKQNDFFFVLVIFLCVWIKQNNILQFQRIPLPTPHSSQLWRDI